MYVGEVSSMRLKKVQRSTATLSRNYSRSGERSARRSSESGGLARILGGGFLRRRPQQTECTGSQLSEAVVVVAGGGAQSRKCRGPKLPIRGGKPRGEV